MARNPVALGTNRPSVRCNQVASDRQAQAASPSVGSPLETLEDTEKVGLRDPIARVGDSELNPMTVQTGIEAN